MNIITQAITGNEQAADTASPYAALLNFYAAFNHQNIDLMKTNWLQSEEASMSNPLGGVKRGWNNIYEVYQKIFSGPATVYVEFFDYTLHGTDAMFVAVGRERGLLQMDKQKIPLAIRTSRIYRLHENRWQQLHHHGSMDDPRLLSEYQNTVLGK
jgi:hypothetical protein